MLDFEITDAELTDKQIELLYKEKFASAQTFDEISNRLRTMKSKHIDELRYAFVNELLYSISIGYTRYDKSDNTGDNAISLFCEEVTFLPNDYPYFHAVRAFFKHEYKACLSLIEQYLVSYTTRYSEKIDEYFLVDRFFEPFKNAFPGFWESLGKMIKRYPHHADVPVLCETIDIYYHCKTDEEALELLLDAQRKCDGSVLLKELIGYTYYSMKMWQNAVAYFEQVEDDRLFFRNDHIFFMMAWCYGKTKDYKQEERFYREVLTYNPENIDARNNLGYCLYKQREYNEAKIVFEECIELFPDYQYSLNNYVRCLLALGRYKDAKAFAKEGHKISSDLKRKVEHTENTNKGKVRTASKEQYQEDCLDNSAIQQTQIDLGLKRQQFSSEKLLEDELTARIEAGMEVFGMKLKLFRRKGLYGRQFIIPIGRLDLLCEDDDGNLYVIELKKDSGYDDAYQQTANYLNWFEQSEYAKGKRVYGIICLNSPTNALIQKVRNDKRMRLFEYAISYTEI